MTRTYYSDLYHVKLTWFGYEIWTRVTSFGTYYEYYEYFKEKVYFEAKHVDFQPQDHVHHIQEQILDLIS